MSDAVLYFSIALFLTVFELAKLWVLYRLQISDDSNEPDTHPAPATTKEQ